MRSFLTTAFGMGVGCVVSLWIFSALQDHRAKPEAIRFIASAHFADTEVQFEEVTGDKIVCMTAFHMRPPPNGLVAVMNCVPK